MSKNICILFTDTNGLHQTNDFLTKKNMYAFARLIEIHYLIGYYKNDKFIETKRVNTILKPKCISFDKEAESFHKISYEKAMNEGSDNESVMTKFKNDLKNIKVIVSHNLPFHLKSIQMECFRTCTNIDFSKYILIDTISFQHKLEFPKLNALAEYLSIKNKKAKDNQLDLMRYTFDKLYSNHIKSIDINI